ncbi:uncharacterized protein TNCV_165581 [Trichonephila clavipes]|nr:uncharacterized protein TNCV_165581 [Trichonephila clavipes]
MSLCGMELHACCTCRVNIATVSNGCGWFWSCRPLISHTCSIGDIFGDLAGQCNTSTLCRACCVQRQCDGERYPEISPQIMTPGVGPECLGREKFGYRRSPGLLLTITNTKAEPTFIRKKQNIFTPSSY